MAPEDHPNGPGIKVVFTPNGYFSSVAASNVTAPTVHIVHKDEFTGENCVDCHWGWSKLWNETQTGYVDATSCNRCHNATTEIFHSEHGNVTTVYSCESDLCHAKTVTAKFPYE